MNNKTLTHDEEIATRMPRNRFFVMQGDGTFANRNAHGKGTRFAFARKGDAMLRVERRKNGLYVFDNKTQERFA